MRSTWWGCSQSREGHEPVLSNVATPICFGVTIDHTVATVVLWLLIRASCSSRLTRRSCRLAEAVLKIAAERSQLNARTLASTPPCHL